MFKNFSSEFSTLKKDAGFTIPELVIVLLIMGFVAVSALSVFLKTRDSIRIRTTEKRMEVVQDALAAFASRNYRIPCPANPAATGPEPFGTERGSGANGAAIPAACAGINREGIVPFSTLGLTAEEVRDGWDRYITYQVSEAYTADPEDFVNLVLNAVPSGNPPVPVHARCRNTDWIEAGRNIAPQKAVFCCTGANLGTDTQICLDNNIACNNPAWPLPRDPNGANYADANTFDVTMPIPLTRAYLNNNYVAIAYALISHGENGAGAFMVDGTANRFFPGQGGTLEQQNYNNTQQNVWALERAEGTAATYFDDIVRWETQAQMLGRLRRESCLSPW